jgi:hypothetical protein
MSKAHNWRAQWPKMQEMEHGENWAKIGLGKAQAGRPRPVGPALSGDGSDHPFFDAKKMKP